MMRITQSKNKVPIRLTHERWTHVIHRHPKMKDYFEEVLLTIEDPDIILEGDS